MLHGDIYVDKRFILKMCKIHINNSTKRTCYFSSKSTMQHSDFMRMINESFPTGGLTCSFQNHQLSEFIQIKRRTVTHMPEKRVVSVVGPQDDDLWVLGPDVHINSQGQSISPEKSSYIWISDMYSGPGVAPKSSACTIQLPLATQSLVLLMDLL